MALVQGESTLERLVDMTEGIKAANRSANTPGPWTAVECCDSCPLPSGVAVAVQTDREPWTSIGRICSMTAQGDGKYDPSVTNANARLIAAAPLLYEALKLTVEQSRCDPECPCETCKKISDALAAAEGTK